VLAKPGSIPPHTNFGCEVYFLTRKKAGAHRVFQWLTPFSFRQDRCDLSGVAAGTEMVMPGTPIWWDSDPADRDMERRAAALWGGVL